MNLFSILLPLAIDILRRYIRSSATDKDDKVLEVVQQGCSYLTPKDSNSISQKLNSDIQTVKFWG